MTHPLLDRLDTGPILADGAIGTMLYAAGASLDESFDALNLSRPELVLDTHRAYLDAGADLLETNSFGANRFKLEAFGLADRVREINKKAVRLAREAREITGRPALIAGSIGPTGRTLAPFGVVSPEEVAERLSGLGVAVIGANCSVGPQRLLPVVEALVRHLGERDGAVPAVSCMPNAGWPAHVAGRVIYPSSPEYFAGFARRAAEAGVRIIGGCCGTTPLHTAAMREALDAWTAERGDALASSSTLVSTHVSRRTRILASPELDLVPAEGPTRLREKLDQGEFVVSVEIDPPKGLNPTKALEGACLLQEAGVDFINVADSPMARVRMSALTMCYLIQHRTGVETILHFTTRDRSLMGLQSELLGAHAVGVRNIIALTGDPPSLGDYPDSSAVYDVDSVGLIRILERLNTGADSAGASIGRPAGFTIACAVDPTRADLEHEAGRLRAKLKAGAHVVMTQPIYDPTSWSRFLDAYGVERLPVPVLAGILPLQSSKHAEFLHNEVPGITLSDEARQRMRLAGPDGRREGVKMAQELLQELRPLVQGVYLMPSFGRYEVAAEVLDVLQREPVAR